MKWQGIAARWQPSIGVQCRHFSVSTGRMLAKVKELQSWDVAEFQAATKNMQLPVVLPCAADRALPAISRWFQDAHNQEKCSLKHDYLDRFGECPVPLELTTAIAAGHVEFRRTHAPLSLFLRWTKDAPVDLNQRIYLAQCQMMDLPKELSEDLPTPEIVKKAGQGDVYDVNIWMGRAPTYTPLHRDPNPNLFYQLAGKKVVRMFPPDKGNQIYRDVRNMLGGSSSASMRGDEMMAGAERVALEERVWADKLDQLDEEDCQEAQLEYGQAMFIPLKWWHSIKGLGTGVTASVNWWFR